jgi:pimeloyl-ACP methyl ester carboxylesterase
MTPQKPLFGTHYWTYGDPSDPVVVMIHGFRGTHHGLDLIVRQLGGYYVVVPDVPGFGDTKPLPGVQTLDAYTVWLHEFIDALNLPTAPVILGHSFGSIITAQFAGKYPDALTKLILVNPIGAPALQGPKAVLTQLAIFYYWLGRILPPALAHKWLAAKSIVMIMSNTMAKTRDKTLRAYIHDQHLQHFSQFADSTTLSQSFNTSVSNNVRQSASDVIVPTLLIAGEIDDITPLAKQYELVKLFPDATLKVINHVGHLTHYETPDQVARLVQDFIKSE